MRVYGVPEGGKRVKLTDRLSILVPGGAVYGKNDDGNYSITQYKSALSGYRNGAFTVDDEEEILWSISNIQQKAVVSFSSEDGEVTPQAVREEMGEKLLAVAKGMVKEDNSSKEPYEPGSSTKVEETAGGFVLRAGISVNAAGGSYRILALPDRLAGAVVKQGFQLFGITMYYTSLLFAVEDCPDAPLFYAALKGPDTPDFYEKTLEPLLATVELEGTGKAAGAQKPKIKRNAAPVVESLDFSRGERVRAGEFSILVPGGMCWSGEITPETRYLTSVPASVTFDDPDWDDVSAVRFTLQTGQKIPAIPAPLDSAEGEGQIRSLLQNMTISQQGAADSGVGELTALARGPEYYICYEMARETGIDYLFRFYLFSRVFVYTGMYIGWKAGLENPLEQHRQILEQWLGTVAYEGGAEAEAARYGRAQFGEYAAEDGKLNAVRIAQLFSTDVLFFNEDDFKENGLKNGLHINSLKLSEHPLLAEKRDVFAGEAVNLLLELDAVPALRVPKGKIHKRLLPLLFNDNDEPLTGMTMMNLLAYHMVHIQEAGADDYAVIIDRNLVAGIPDAYRYVGAFLRQLRLYNGKDGAFTITFANAMNFDTPIQGALKPVDGAAQPRSMYRIRVERDGTVQELEAEEDAGQPEQGEQKSIQELEAALPPEFTAKMRRFAGDVAGRLGQLCGTLQKSAYDDLTNTDAVLDRLMDQAQDYGLFWGIFNFYSIFTLGTSDSTFTFEKSGADGHTDTERPEYRIDEPYEDYAEGDPSFQPEEFPRQLAERIGGITEEEIYRTLLEQAAGYLEQGYTLVDQERIRIEKQQKELEKVPFDMVDAVKVAGSAFVLTGEFAHCGNDREAVKAKIQEKGGRVTGSISGKTSYLVIGGLGAFGERKLEQVQAQRAKGSAIKIIREEDLFAALEGRPADRPAAKAPEKPKKKSASPKAGPEGKGAETTEEKAGQPPCGRRVSLIGDLTILLPEGGDCTQGEDGSCFLSIPITLPDGSTDVWNIANFTAMGSIPDAFDSAESEGWAVEGAMGDVLQGIVSRMTEAAQPEEEETARLQLDQTGENTYRASISLPRSLAGGEVKQLKLGGGKGAVAVEQQITVNGADLKTARLFVAVADGADCELYMGVVLLTDVEGDAFYQGALAPLLDTLEIVHPETPDARKEAGAQLLNVLQTELGKAEDSRQVDYDNACRAMEKAKSITAFRKAAEAFGALGGYRDSEARKARCLERTKELEEQRRKKAEEQERLEREQAAKRQADYDSACQAMEKAKSITAFRKAAKAFGTLEGYRDSDARRAQCQEQVRVLEEEQRRKKAEEQQRLERERAERAAAEQAAQLARQQALQARRKKLRRKVLVIAILVVAAIAVLLGVKSYIDNAPYRELAASIDDGTFHYSRYEGSYFLQYDGSHRVIAEKLTGFHRRDDIQSAVQLIGSLPPNEGALDYYIDGRGIYMTESFREWFANRAEEDGTAVTVTGIEPAEDRDINFYQMGDFIVEIIYDISDASKPRLQQAVVIDTEEGNRITLGAEQSYRYYGEQYGIQ